MLSSINTMATELSFKNSSLISGTDKRVGAVYRFSQVSSNTDALVKILRFNNGASIVDIDKYGRVGLDDAFQPTLRTGNNNDSSVDFEITFVRRGTSVEKAITFNATGADIDGDGRRIKEYISLSTPLSYSLETPTRLVVSSNANGLHAIPRTTANVSGITVGETRNIITAAYKNTSKILYRVGAKNAKNKERYNSLYFKDVKYTEENEVVKVTHKISGSIFEDISGDLFADGDERINNASGDQVSKNKVNVYLYRDNGNGEIDSEDVFVEFQEDTIGNGRFEFEVEDGKYFVLTDSKTFPSKHTYHSGKEQGDVWAEQTWGPKGGFCADGAGGTKVLTEAGACYGGRRADVSDDVSSIENAEHIAFVELSGEDIEGIDFGFSFNVITNINDQDDDNAKNHSSQGSFRQFLQNSNAITDKNELVFNIKTPANKGEGWKLTLQEPLPIITDDGLVIDGLVDENATAVGHSGAKVGTGVDGVEDSGDETSLGSFLQTKLEIDANDQVRMVGSALGGVFVIDADDVTIKHIALYNGTKDNNEGADKIAGILVHGGTNTIISENLLGTDAAGNDPGAGKRLNNAIYHDSNEATQITDNFIAHIVYGGIWAGDNAYIAKNELYKASNTPTGDAITTEDSDSSAVIIIENNWIEGSSAYGIESWNSPSKVLIRNNTLIANGQDTSAENEGENGGIRIYGQDNVIEQNIVKEHIGAGIVIVGDKNENTVSKNSTYDNGGLAVDIDQRESGNRNGDGVNANDGLKKSNKANKEMDYPIFTTISQDGDRLHLEGYVGTKDKKVSGVSKVELFKSDVDTENMGEIEEGDEKSVAHGEGRWYIGDFETESDGSFSKELLIPASVMLDDEDFLTAIAIDQDGSSSEFGANYPSHYSSNVPSAKLEYRFDECAWSGSEGEVKEVNGNDATSKNGASTQHDAMLNKSALLTGNNYIDTGDMLDDIKDTFTITAWINPSSLTEDMTNHETKNTILAKASDSANDNLEIGVNPNGSLHVYLDTNGKNKFADIGSGITTGNWHFVVVSYDGNTLRATIDDNHFEDSTTWSAGGDLDAAVGSPFTIGASLHEDNYFSGGMDEVKVFDKVLDTNVIQTIYTNEKAGNNYDGVQGEASQCPASEYRFDACTWYGNEGEVKDIAGSNSGKALNKVETSDAGRVVRSAVFSGGYILAENEIEMLEDFTISFWINPADVERENAYMAVLSKQIELYLTQNNKLNINLKNPDESFSSSAALEVDVWSHVVVQKDGDKVTIFINGDKDKEKDIDALTDNGLDTIMIGKTDWDGADLFAGKLDELKLYTSALSTSKLNEIYQNEKDVKNYDGSTREEVICLSPIGCIDEAIIIDDSKFVFEVDLATGLNTRFEIDATAGGMNGFGFNKKDGYIWGYNHTKKNGTLLRVGKTKEGAYAQEVFGPIDALKGKGFYIGDIDDEGQLYLYGAGIIYIIDIDPASDSFLSVLDSFSVGKITVADMAFNPVDKLLYAIESDNDLYQIDLEDKKTTLLKADVVDTTTDTFGSSFFDSAGFFYAIKNSSRDVYRIDVSDRENIRALKFSSLSNADVQNVNIDGGRCSDRPIYIDYGDAPDGSAYDSGDGTDTLNYKTLTSDNGARHKIFFDKPNVFFGDGNVSLNVSPESDAKEGNLDDDNGLEGGLNPLFTSMYKYSLNFAVQNDTNKSANVVGWIDFNRNGRFEMDEGTSTSVLSENKDVVTLQWDVPDDIKEGMTYARFRVSTDDMATLESDSYGIKTDGEVEDYEIIIKRGSLYDAWDEDSNLTSRVIKTKIVNEDIALNIASVSRDGESIIENTFTEIKAGLFSKDDGSTLHDFVDINFTQANPYRVDFGKIEKAVKYSYVKITYLDESNVTQEVNATDAFSIRPNRYDMTIQAPDGLVAGKDFNITIKALGALGSTVVNYDENVSVYGLDYNETLVGNGNGCVRGVLTAPKVAFSGGVATIVSHYDNVGQLDLKAYEVEDVDTEFAVVDKDDGSNESRYIEDDSLQTDKFSPSNITLDWDFTNGSDAYTFYDSNLSEMAAPLYVAIKAQDENNVTVTNFRDGCYAEDVIVKVDFDIEGVAQSITPQTDTTVAYTVPLADIASKTFSFKVLKGDFADGEGNETVRVNFQRERNRALEPMKFTISDINSTTTGGVSAWDDEDKVATFVYLRVHVTDQSVIGKTINARVDYEVYSRNSDRGLFGLASSSESRDSINWYIISSDLNMDYSDVRSTFETGITVTHTSRDEIAIEVEKLPHSNIIRYTPSFGYLLYDRYSTSIQSHNFKVRFNPEEAKWTGKGDLGMTVDHRAYKGNGVQKLDW